MPSAADVDEAASSPELVIIKYPIAAGLGEGHRQRRRVGHDGTETCPALVLLKAPKWAIFTHVHGMHHTCTTSHAACTPRAFRWIFF